MGLNIQLSETLTTNVAHNIKILNMNLWFRGECIQKIFPEIKNLAKQKYLFNYINIIFAE